MRRKESKTTAKTKKHNKILFFRNLLIIIISIVVIVFLFYAGFYYHADKTAITALRSDEAVDVSKTDYGWFFDGPSEKNAFIFYPGAKVEETAYAPLLHSLAEKKLDVCLVKMPLRFAFFGINRADSVMKKTEYDHWYVGGHSLGGAMAAEYAAKHSNKVDGVIFLASYTKRKLNDRMIEIVIYGTEDKICSINNIEKGRRIAPKQYYEYRIKGGNHAQFGNYGIQSGDGTAFITGTEQQSRAVRAIIKEL